MNKLLNNNLFFLLLSGMVFITVPSVTAEDNIRALKTYNARLPIYHNDRLQFFIYSRELLRQGQKVSGEDAVIDIIRRGANTDAIKYLDKFKPYSLDTPDLEVLDFWKDKLHSDGVITSAAVDIDQNAKVASGKEKVFFRSPALDLNGVGFLANYEKRNILVRKDVKIKIRMGVAQQKSGDKKDELGNVFADADSMFLDFEKNEITLEGNVKVNESRLLINCDKLILFLKDGTIKNLEKGEANPKKSAAANTPAVSKIICLGKVKIDRKLSAEEQAKSGSQTATAGKAVYDLTQDQIVLSEDNPVISRGKDTIAGKTIILWKNTERMQVEKDGVITMRIPKKAEEKAKPDSVKPSIICADAMDIDYPGNLATFTGNVKINDTMMDVDCHKMTIYLEDRNNPKSAKTKSTADNDANAIENAKNTKDVVEIICSGDVIISRKVADPSETAFADKAIYNLKESKIILSGNNPILIRGRDSISGQLVTVWVDQQRMTVDKNSKIILESAKSNAAAGATGKTSRGAAVLTSDFSDINYGSNQIYFAGNVKVKDPQLDLVCQKMTIILEEKPVVKAKEKVSEEDPFKQIEAGNTDKDVSKIICIGDVQASDPKMSLNCDKMTIHMSKKAGDAAKKTTAAGPMGSDGSREVSRIICEGKVQMESKEQPKDAANEKVSAEDGLKGMVTKGSSGKIIVNTDFADLKLSENFAELIGKVVVKEPRATLQCKKMLIYAVNTGEVKVKKAGDLDDQDIVGSDDVPARISLGENKELERIICIEDVVIVRNLSKDEPAQRATGDKALYEVMERKITLTGTETKYPTMERDKDIMEGDKIVLWLNSEKLDINNGRVKAGTVPK
jgi:lipopolysaccharide export system protein LptA